MSASISISLNDQPDLAFFLTVVLSFSTLKFMKALVSLAAKPCTDPDDKENKRKINLGVKQHVPELAK